MGQPAGHTSCVATEAAGTLTPVVLLARCCDSGDTE